MEKAYVVVGVVDYESGHALKVFRSREGAENLVEERKQARGPFREGIPTEDWCEIEEVETE